MPASEFFEQIAELFDGEQVGGLRYHAREFQERIDDDGRPKPSTPPSAPYPSPGAGVNGEVNT